MIEKTYLRVILEDAERHQDEPNNGYKFLAHTELTPLLNALYLCSMDQVMGYWDLEKVICDEAGDVMIQARRLDVNDPSESEVGTWMKEVYRIPAEVVDAANPALAAHVIQQRQVVKNLTRRHTKAQSAADEIKMRLDYMKRELARNEDFLARTKDQS